MNVNPSAVLVGFSTRRIEMWFIVLGILSAAAAERVRWEELQCSTDVRPLPEGRLRDNSRFPWLGVLQHTFQLENFSKFAISPAILIHPAYVLCAARDVRAVPEERLRNFTSFVALRAEGGRSSTPVLRAVLHPEFPARSLASVALVELDPSAASYFGDHNPGPVLPVCLPVSGVSPRVDQLYTLQMTDEGGALGKKAFKMSFLDDRTCDEFYQRAGLNISRVLPVHGVCAAGTAGATACVWDDGSALVSRQGWEQFKLLGFGVHGPGCGAPARFLYIPRYMPWIEGVLAVDSFLDLPGGVTEEDQEDVSGRRAGVPGRRTPVLPYPKKGDEPFSRLFALENQTAIYLFKERDDDDVMRRGECGAKVGQLVYQDRTAVNAGPLTANGYFYLEVFKEATFTCIAVQLEQRHYNELREPAMWLEHHCPRNYDGRVQYDRPKWQRCFLYYISTAHVKIGFQLQGKGELKVQVFASEAQPTSADPGLVTDTTSVWQPTTTDLFLPRLFRGEFEADTPTEW